MSLDMGSIFIVNHPILNLGFWMAKSCEKLKQEASAKKAKACLCLFWPLPSVCPHSISSYQLSLCFAAGPTFFYEEYWKTFECPLLGIASHIAQTLSAGLNWFGCALFHRRTSAPTRLAEAVPLVDFAFSLSLAASRAISLAKEKPMDNWTPKFGRWSNFFTASVGFMIHPSAHNQPGRGDKHLNHRNVSNKSALKDAKNVLRQVPRKMSCKNSHMTVFESWRQHLKWKIGKMMEH